MNAFAPLALVALLLSLGACGGGLDDPCNPQSDPSDCNTFDGYTCISCAPHGYSASQGYCYMEDYADTSYEHICEEAWGGPGGGDTTCGGDPSGCAAAWTGSTSDHAQYNCQAACAEQAACNDAGVKANCDILRGYGAQTVSLCTTCR